MTAQPSRQPAGVPVGGQFTHGTHAEPDVLIQPTPFVTLAPGEDDGFEHLCDDQIMHTFHITRDDDGDFHVSPGCDIHPGQVVTAEDLGTDEAGHQAWLEKHRTLIQDFIAVRYEADVRDDEDGVLFVEFDGHHDGQTLTEAQAMNIAWNNTRIVQLHNESDPGTFGTENLNRLILEKAAASTVIENHQEKRAEAERLQADPRHLDSIVSLRLGEREIPDAAAMAIARDLAATNPGTYPALGKLGTFGHTDTKAMQDELHHAYQEAPNPLIKRRIDMMGTWILNGGDND